jgi:hypothetical protein
LEVEKRTLVKDGCELFPWLEKVDFSFSSRVKEGNYGSQEWARKGRVLGPS